MGDDSQALAADFLIPRMGPPLECETWPGVSLASVLLTLHCDGGDPSIFSVSFEVPHPLHRRSPPALQLQNLEYISEHFRKINGPPTRKIMDQQSPFLFGPRLMGVVGMLATILALFFSAGVSFPNRFMKNSLWKMGTPISAANNSRWLALQVRT